MRMVGTCSLFMFYSKLVGFILIEMLSERWHLTIQEIQIIHFTGTVPLSSYALQNRCL